jgi:hypothetical protein
MRRIWKAITDFFDALADGFRFASVLLKESKEEER